MPLEPDEIIEPSVTHAAASAADPATEAPAAERPGPAELPDSEAFPFPTSDDAGDFDVVLEDGTIAFLGVARAVMNEHRRAGRDLHVITVDLVAHDGDRGDTPADLVATLEKHGSIIDAYVSTGPVPPLDLAAANQLPFVVLFATAVAEADLPGVLGLGDDACALVARAAGSTPTATTTRAAPSTTEQSPPVSVTNLGMLLDIAGELVLSRNQLLLAAQSPPGEERERRLGSITGRIDHLTSELLGAIQQARVQSVEAVFRTFPRIVRDLSEQLGTQIHLDVDGTGAELAPSIRASIGDALALAIMPALVVAQDGHRYAIPQASIREVIRVKPADVDERIDQVDDAAVLRLRGDRLPLIELASVLDGDRIPEPFGGARTVRIVVVESGPRRFGLVVDDIADLQEIVAKPLGRHLKDCDTLAGATVLADGSVAFILDVARVAEAGRVPALADRVAGDSDSGPDIDGRASAGTQLSLVFTNDERETFAVPITQIRRIERILASDIQTIDDQEVLRSGGHALPLVSLEQHLDARPRAVQDQYHVVVFSGDGADVGLIVPQIVEIRDLPAHADDQATAAPDDAPRMIDVTALGRTASSDDLGDESPPAAGGPKATILLAEHSSFFRVLVRGLLESHGYEVIGCEDGQRAWQALQDPSRSFDAVLTDIEMPKMNGYELTRAIRADPMFAHLPVIALSSLSGDEDVKRARDAGVTAYQIKLDRESLLADIARALQASREQAGLGSERSAGVPA